MDATTPVQKREIRSVLVANRGEVAIRVAKTCEEMGLRTVVIFTDSDAGAPFTKVGQNAVHIGENRNYINIPVVVAAAKKAGVDAIHPGYGFLAESAPFAAAVADAGLIFIGPSAKTISELGSKIGAKRLLSEKASQVPLIPGFYPAKGEPEPATPQEWLAKAKAIGYPVLIKAAAGGGGKGMRVVREEKEFLESLDSAKTEAKGAFGDESVMLERYFENVRHIEVQILGDAYGNVDHLNERECSIQRRHQKLLEESPSPALSAETRQQILNAAVTVGRSVHYQGAGTVEFIVETDRSNTAVPPTSATPKFYFLEVNTRLQVEHAVTEQCRGADIVKMQILIAGGMPLAEAAAASSRRGPVPIARPPASPCSSLLSVGYSIEARVYAEDDNFMPCVGVVTAWQPADTMAVYHTATAVGNKQGVSYDGLLCKVIVYATESRDAARRKLITALQRLACFGVYSNRRALINLLNHPTVVVGDMTTDLIDKGVITPAEIQAPLKTLLRPTPDWGNNIYAQAVRVIDAVIKQQKTSNRTKWPLVPARWSNNTASKIVSMTHSFVPLPQGSLPPPKLTITHNAVGRGADTAVVSSEGGVAENFSIGEEITARHVGGVVYEVQLVAGGPTERVAVQIDRHAESIQPQVAMLENGAKVGAVCHVQFFECGNLVSLGLLHRLSGQPVTRPSNDDALPGSLVSATSSNAGPLQPGEVRSPIPAKVVKVLQPTGSKVKKGDVVVVLESMKMERKMAALNDGVTVVGLNVGDLVQAGGTVFIVTPAS